MFSHFSPSIFKQLYFIYIIEVYSHYIQCSLSFNPHLLIQGFGFAIQLNYLFYVEIQRDSKTIVLPLPLCHNQGCYIHGHSKHFQFEPAFCERFKACVYIHVFACGCPVVSALFIEKTILSSLNHLYYFVRYSQLI